MQSSGKIFPKNEKKIKEWMDYFWSKGMVIIPLKNGDKRPTVAKFPELTLEQSIEKCTNSKAQNFGITTGKNSNLFVIDVDVKDDGLKCWQEEILPNIKPFKTLTVRSARGGLHIYFRLDKRIENFGNGTNIYRRDPKNNKEKIGIDIRANGGFIVAPGTVFGLKKNTKGSNEVCLPFENGENNCEYKIISETDEISHMPDDIYEWLMSPNCAHYSHNISSSNISKNKKAAKEVNPDFMASLDGKPSSATKKINSMPEEEEDDREALPLSFTLEQIKELLEHISAPAKGDSFGWNKFQNVCFALKTCGSPKELFEFWRDKCGRDTQDLNGCLKCANRGVITLGTILFYLKQDDPKFYKKWMNENASFRMTKTEYQMLGNIELFKGKQPIIEWNETIRNELISELFSASTSPKLICIKANCGMQKTITVNHFINKMKAIPGKTILFITSRRNNANKAEKELGIANYMSIEETDLSSKEYPHLIINYDSLWRLTGKFDVVILDECCQTMRHMKSPFCKKSTECYRAFKHFLKEAETTVALDALLEDKEVNYLEKTIGKGETIVYWNKFKKWTDTKVHYIANNKEFILKILDHIDYERVAVSSSSKSLLKKLKTMIEKRYPEKKVKLVVNDPYDEENDLSSSSLGDLIDGFDQCDVVLYSPKIASGSSFSKMHFDSLFCYYTPKSVAAETALQMSFRIRCTTTGNMYMCVDRSKHQTLFPSYVKSFEDFKEYLIQRDFRRRMNPNFLFPGELFDKDMLSGEWSASPILEYYYEDAEQINLSFKNYSKRILQLLSTHGVELAEDIDVSKMKANPEITEKQLNFLKSEIANHNHEQDQEESVKIFNAPNLTAEEYQDMKEKGSAKRKHSEDMAIMKYELATTLSLPPSHFSSKEELSEARNFVKKHGKQQLENFKILPSYIENETKLQVDLYNIYDYYKNDQKYDKEERILQLLNKGYPQVDRKLSCNIIWLFLNRLGFNSIDDLLEVNPDKIKRFTAKELLDVFTSFSNEMMEFGDYRVSMKSKIYDIHRVKFPSKIQEVKKYLNGLVSGVFPFKFKSMKGKVRTEKQIFTLEVAQWKDAAKQS